MITLSLPIAEQFAALTLRNVVREYPHKLDHVMDGDADVRPPRELHPIFFGCFDWHSCVHGYWQLATLHRLVPNLSTAPAIEAQINAAFTPENVAAEVAYFHRPSSRGFERPYGWAWLLALATELSRGAGVRAEWHRRLAPLASEVADRWKAFLPHAAYPIRSGAHANSAFAITLTRDYAAAHHDAKLLSMVTDRAMQWYGTDENCPAWEPSLDDFLSPALMQARCMRDMLPPAAFQDWLGRFLPDLAVRRPDSIFTPAAASDRTDGKIAHLDGLNFSRAWCMAGIAAALSNDDPRRAVLLHSAQAHVAVSLPHIAADYAGEHWLATFALLALIAIDACNRKPSADV